MENCDLTAFSSAGIPARSGLAVYPDNEEKLVKIIAALSELPLRYTVIGGMTNVLVRNGFYDGVIVKTDKIRTKCLAERKITLGAGVRMSGVIHRLASLGLGGMEGLCGIPGTVGGMVKQNAGAYGYEISDTFHSCICYMPRERRLNTLYKDDMRFEYRGSILSDSNAVLISATFELVTDASHSISDKIQEFKKRRLASQPIEYPSYGSVFKRYKGQSAGFYIDKAGLKGVTIGGAQVSTKHAGFIINVGGATADDFLRLIDHVKERVFVGFGIELEEELEII